jgi:Cytochrome P460
MNIAARVAWFIAIGASAAAVFSAADSVVIERYANQAALQAARTGQPLPDNSMIVVANRHHVPDGKGQPTKGPANSYSAMASRAAWGAAVPALLRNGNWDYAAFNARGVRNDRLNQSASYGPEIAPPTQRVSGCSRADPDEWWWALKDSNLRPTD